MEIYGGEMQEHHKKSKKALRRHKIKRGKDFEHEICVITWNVNKSAAQ